MRGSIALLGLCLLGAVALAAPRPAAAAPPGDDDAVARGSKKKDKDKEEEPTPAPEEAADTTVMRSNRMEFDERLVKGQSASSGAVYLFKRVPRHLPGLVPMRRSYRARIVEPVLGERELKPAVYSTEVEDVEYAPAGDEQPDEGGRNGSSRASDGRGGRK